MILFEIEDNMSFKKLFLILIIIGLSISALIGIFIFLTGTVGEIEAKILLTTLVLGGFSLTALCSAALYDKNKWIVFPIIGIIAATFGFLMAIISIWIRISPQIEIWKFLFISIIISASIAQSSLLLLIPSNKTLVRVSLLVTLSFISIVAFMLSYLVWIDFDLFFDSYYRFLGVFMIFDVLGTIVTPIILKITLLNKN
jgi:hypothetical protein